MTKLNIIGDSGRRKSKYVPNLAEEVNKQVEEEERRKRLEAKLGRKKKSAEQPLEDTTEQKPNLTIPDNVEYFFLEGDFGRGINEKVQEKYGRYDAISKIQFDEQDNIVKGSTPFYCVAVQEFLPENITIATQSNLEKILKGNILQLQGYYEDSSLVWRSNQEPNEYLAKYIYKQFKAKGIELEEGKAYVIPLFTLKLRENSEYPHKLAFDITELTLQTYFEALILNEVSHQKFNSDDIDEKIGLPKRVGSVGNRTLYTRNFGEYAIKNSGFCGLCLDGDLNANSSVEYLAVSDAGGRVVCVRAEGTTLKNLGGK